MNRCFTWTFLSLTLVSPAAFAQDGPLNRAGRALDNAGKNIRNRVETEVARGQVNVQERDVLYRVIRRIEWDKQLVSSVLQIEAQPGGVVILRGSVMSEVARKRTIDLVENTIGVTKVVSEIALVKEVKITETVPPTQAIVTPVDTPVVIPSTAPVPPGTKVIIKPRD